MFRKGISILVYFLYGIFISSVSSSASPADRPNIIFILADDAGWNDFSFHGSPQIPTPNIDFLALNGIILNSYYGNPLCTPTRGSIMTGKYPIHLKLQHFVISGGSIEGLPLGETLLPQYLKELGYSTHLVGKWHLGHSSKEYTPTYRGFDSHFGYWLGKQDYYDHFSYDSGQLGYDFRSNLTVDYSVFGKYDTHLFTDKAVKLIEEHSKENPLFLMVNHIAPHSGTEYSPLQAPEESIRKFDSTIKNINRRKYAGVMDTLDESVGEIVNALGKKGILKNSIIIFASDNGGSPEGYDLNFGSNWPLRGVKNTLWEGGTRLASLIWAPFLSNRIMKGLFHVSDWLPTLYEACGGNVTELGEIDGISQWSSFKRMESAARHEFLYNIDPIYNNSAIRVGPWKLIQGNTSPSDLSQTDRKWDGHYGPSGREGSQPISSLIPLILNSQVAQAFENSGIPANDAASLLQFQKLAEVKCPENSEESEFNCNPYQSPCLFNLREDPCEHLNLANKAPGVLKMLLERLKEFNKTALKPNTELDPMSAPRNWNYTWTNWKDFI